MVLTLFKPRVWKYLTVNGCTHGKSSIRNCAKLYFVTNASAKSAGETKRSAPWSIMFFGTDEFALRSFKILNEKYESRRLLKRLEIVTAYKGKKNAIINYANEHGIAVHSWPLSAPLSEFDMGVVVSFGHLIPARVIDAFPLGMINVHASLLPKLRGAAPIIHAVMNGHSRTGITIMKIMPHKFDIGDILAQEAVDIHPDETMPELYDKLARLGAELLIKTIEKFPDGLLQGRLQSDENVTYAHKITAKSSMIRWSKMNARNVYDLQRALTGLYPPTTMLENKTIKLFGIRVYEDLIEISDARGEKPGRVLYDKKKDVLIVECKDKTWISIERIVMPGRRPMSARDFKNGFMAAQKRPMIFFR